MQDELTLEQKHTLYRDGYVIVRNAVPEHLVAAAKRRIEAGEGLLSKATEMTDLVNKSSVTPILHEAMGYFDPPIAAQVGVRPVTEPGNHFNNLGYRERDMPYYAAESHVDGSMTIRIPQEVQDGTPDEIYRRYIASGPKGDLGRSPDVIGHNLVPMFEDPDMTLGLGSFTAFVFVCLNDQTVEGRGQTALLRGAHHAVEEFFRFQRDTNNHLGVEGPGWPRLDYTVPNRCGLIYLPEACARAVHRRGFRMHARRSALAAPHADPHGARRRVHHRLPDPALRNAQRGHRTAPEHHLQDPQQEAPSRTCWSTASPTTRTAASAASGSRSRRATTLGSARSTRCATCGTSGTAWATWWQRLNANEQPLKGRRCI